MSDSEREGGLSRLQKIGGIAVAAIAVLGFFGIRGFGGDSPSHDRVVPPSRTRADNGPKPSMRLSAPVYLDTLPEVDGAQVQTGLVSVDGRHYQHGLQFNVGTIGLQSASYRIPAGASTFSAVIGNDDTQDNSIWNLNSIALDVLVDGRRVATARARARVHDPPVDRVSVAGGSQIELRVYVTGEGAGGTNVDWANPVFR